MLTAENSITEKFIETIVSDRHELRDRPFEDLCVDLTVDELLKVADGLDQFRRSCSNLYHQVRALFFLTSLHRYQLPCLLDETKSSHISYSTFEQILQRHSSEAIDQLVEIQSVEGPSHLISSSLAKAYHQLAFQRLADQVRRSVRTVQGNQWMFRIGHPADYPLRLDKRLLKRESEQSISCVARTNQRANGFLAFRLERYLLLGNGFP